jgi:SsrA-binding protein
MSKDVKVMATNRKARHDYEIEETYEAGLELRGTEIKSIRAGQVSLKEAYVRTDGEEAWLMNAHIAPYEMASQDNHQPTRDRRLLLHKREIVNLFNDIQRKGFTIIPLSIYLKGGRAKIEIATARGKHKYDKRQALKKRDAQLDIERAMKDRH